MYLSYIFHWVKEISTIPLPTVVVKAPKVVSTLKVTQGSKESVKGQTEFIPVFISHLLICY